MKSATPFNSRTEVLPHRKEVSRNKNSFLCMEEPVWTFQSCCKLSPKNSNSFGSHSLDKAIQFIPEILSSSQISHCIPLNHCKLLSRAFTVTP